MFRLQLVVVLVVLIVATASAESAENVRRRTCYWDNADFQRCNPRTANYTVLAALGRARSIEKGKEVLQGENALEDLCSEGTRLLHCLSNAVKSPSAECLQQYNRDLMTTENFDKGLTLVEELCTDEHIETARQNLDCVVNDALVYYVGQCAYANPDHDCSQVQPDDYESLSECYSEKYRRNCNVAEVLECIARRVFDSCNDGDITDLVILALNDLYHIVPICPANHSLKILQKFFRK